MVELSILDKLKMFINTAISSPFFLVSIILGIVLILIMVLDILKFKKMHRYFYIICWCVVFLLIVIKYGKSILNITDNLFEKILEALYFPNFIVYTIIFLISNIYFLFTFFKKRVRRSFRIIGIINVILIDILFLMVIETVVSNNINIYSDVEIYTNKNLTAWLQLTTAIFTSMLLIYLLTSAYYKVKRYDKTGLKYNKNLPPIISDEIPKEVNKKFTDKDRVFVWKKFKR